MNDTLLHQRIANGIWFTGISEPDSVSVAADITRQWNIYIVRKTDMQTHFKFPQQSDITLCAEIADDEPTSASVADVVCTRCLELIAEIRRQTSPEPVAPNPA